MKQIFNNLNEQTKAYTVKFSLTGLALLFTLGAFAQGAGIASTNNSASLFSNTLFNVLLGVIIFLIIIIAVLGSVLKGVGEVTLKKNSKNNKILTVATMVGLLCSSNMASAQSAINTTSSSGYSGLPNGLFFLMLLIIAFELIAVLVLISCIKLLIKKEETVIEKTEPSFLEKLNASVAIEKENDIMMDHEYDGIRELDNDLPPWWKYGFYISIVSAFIYLINFHVIKTGDLQNAEYDKSIAEAKLAKEEYEKQNANNVNENNVTMLTNEAEIEKGKSVFMDMCAACHGKEGQGGVGPNLTDDYWIHGGSIKDVFKSIKFGWPDKGMKSWQADLSPIQIHQISSFIKTLNGTNPPNPKEKQGELYVEEGVVKSDSVVVDSVAVKADSLKVK